MSYKEKEIEKIYWSIGEVAVMFSMPQSAIRFWLDYFKIPVGRNSKGQRKFTKEDIDKIRLLDFLIHTKLYTLPGAKIKFDKVVMK